MKIIIIVYIALGFVLSTAIGIKYSCLGQEMFPTYYGSPFVFKQKSLASSMEYFYSISGLLLNVLIWGFALFCVDKAIRTLTLRVSKKKLINIPYKITIGLMIVFSTLNIAANWIMIGRGFNKGQNYWYWNLDNEAKDWGMTCSGELMLFAEWQLQ